MNICFLSSCNEEKKRVDEDLSFYKGDEMADDGKSTTFFTKIPVKKQTGKTKYEEIKYSCSILSALDYLEHKNIKPDGFDAQELRNEAAVILEIELKNENLPILEAKRNEFSKDQIMQYVVGEIVNDFSIEQNGKTFSPEGSSYENSFGKQNRFRVVFYFKNLNMNEQLRAVYNDKIFGAGLLNFGLNKKLDIQ